MESLSHIDALNSRYGIAGVAEISAGNGGFPRVRITTEAADAEIYLYGAHITSWQPRDSDEVLFVSRESSWEAGRAIRGGIPVCFPWFAEKTDDANAPKHGVVRTREWRLDSLSVLDDGSVTLVCVTESDASTRAYWPHEYCVAYRMTFGSRLKLELSVINTGKTPMRFEEALHSYFRVGKVEDVRVLGLEHTEYLDKTDSYRRKAQADGLVFTEETDRVFLNTVAPVDVVDPALRRRIRTEKKNSDTTVVWNPWAQSAASFSDFGNDEWQQMVCVEASNALTSAVLVAPGEEHTLRVTLSVLPQ